MLDSTPRCWKIPNHLTRVTGKSEPLEQAEGGGSDEDLHSQPVLQLAGMSPGRVLTSLCLGPRALERRGASPLPPGLGLLTARTLHPPPDSTP